DLGVLLVIEADVAVAGAADAQSVLAQLGDAALQAPREVAEADHERSWMACKLTAYLPLPHRDQARRLRRARRSYARSIIPEYAPLVTLLLAAPLAAPAAVGGEAALTAKERAFLRAARALFGEGAMPARLTAWREAAARMQAEFPGDDEVALQHALALVADNDWYRDVKRSMQ